VFYLAAIPLAFVSPWIASGLYTFVALLWLIPDRRIERALGKREQ
jgi:TMEM175 potassium channel family protein